MTTPSATTTTTTIRSDRLGTVEVPEGRLLELPGGLVGLPGTRYALIPAGPDSPFFWLQSAEDPGLALPVCNPLALFEDFSLELSDTATQAAGLPEDPAAVDVWVTVRPGDAPGEFVANLRGPIVVAGGVGRQVVNEAPGADVRAPLF